MVALLHLDAREVDVEAVDAAGNPRGEVGEARLVVGDLAHHADLGLDEAPLDRAGLYAHERARGRPHREPAHALVVACAGLHRDEVHGADRARARLGKLDLRMHGAGPHLRCRRFRAGSVAGVGGAPGRSGPRRGEAGLEVPAADERQDHEEGDPGSGQEQTQEPLGRIEELHDQPRSSVAPPSSRAWCWVFFVTGAPTRRSRWAMARARSVRAFS